MKHVYIMAILAILTFLTLGCGDYLFEDVDWDTPEDTDFEQDEPEYGQGMEHPTNTEDQDSGFELDTEPTLRNDLPESPCGWWIDDGLFSTDEPVWVQNKPEVRLVSAEEIEVAPGVNVPFRFEISSMENCGDIELVSFFLFVQDEENIDWLNEINEDEVDMTLTEISTGQEFLTFAAFNKNVTPTGDELHYIWRADGSIYAEEVYGETMTARKLEGDKPLTYEFSFTGTNYAEEGMVFDMALVEFEWVDLETGAHIRHQSSMYETWTTVYVE